MRKVSPYASKNNGPAKSQAPRRPSRPLGKPASKSHRAPPASAKAPRDEVQANSGRETKTGSRLKLDIPRGIRVVIGTHSILEAIATNPKGIKELWLKTNWESSQDLKKIQQELRPHKIEPMVKPDSVFERLGGSHQGAAILMNTRPELDWTKTASLEESTLLVLDGIEDPHNLGAILRTSWLMSVQGILIPEDRAVGLTATVHKVACGGVEHVPVQECTSFANPLEELKKQGYWIFGLSHEGKKTIFDLKIPEKVVWCIGAEDKGLRVTTERLCDELVSIPQVSASASYNASVATSIALTETLRQRIANREKTSAIL